MRRGDVRSDCYRPRPTERAPSRRRAPGGGSSSLFVLGLAVLLVFAWAREGAAQATLVKDINTSAANGNSYPWDVLDLGGGTILFSATAYDRIYLYRSDGSLAGTTRVTSAVQASDREAFGADYGLDTPMFLASSGIVFFSGSSSSSVGEPWRSDGTALGTYPLADIMPGSGASYPGGWTESGGRAFFTAEGPDGMELYSTDGSALGTTKIWDLNPAPTGSYASRLTALGGDVFFFADDGVSGYELFKSDGTEAGTTMVANLGPGSEDGFSRYSPPAPRVANGLLYFPFDDGVTGLELWKTDGTSAGTGIVADIRPAAVGSFPSGSPTGIGGLLFFAADDGIAGAEPWQTDGTLAGTGLLADIATGPADSAPGLDSPGFGSYPSFAYAGGRLFLFASDADYGYELRSIAVPEPTLTSTLLSGAAYCLLLHRRRR